VIWYCACGRISHAAGEHPRVLVVCRYCMEPVLPVPASPDVNTADR